MPKMSPNLNAAIRALHGESDANAISPALSDWRFSRIIALAPDTHFIVRAVAALSGILPHLLDTQTIANPALHDAVARLIRTSAGYSVLDSWAKIVTAGWGQPYAPALHAAAQKQLCGYASAAALIGPGDVSARLLDNAYDIAFAIRCWGHACPDHPTAWMHALSAGEQDRLLDTVRSDSYVAALCIPWLPPNLLNQISFDTVSLNVAFDMFAIASPTVRALHADLLQRLVGQAQPANLDELTRLACAMKSKEVWERVQALIWESPDDASHVVTAAPWDDLEETVRTAILEQSDRSDICAAVAAAQGCTVSRRITDTSAAAFFATLDPKVWDALPSPEQRRWRDARLSPAAHLAVRSLGLHTEFLARAWTSDLLVRAAQRHTRNNATLHWALLPVALRNLPLDIAYALMTEISTPSNCGAFFCIASEYTDPSIIVPACNALRTHADLSLAVVLQRCTNLRESMLSRCAALQEALRGQSWSDVESILPLLHANVRTTLIFDVDERSERLAHPDHKGAMRTTLSRLKSLPPEVAAPTFVALHDPGSTLDRAQAIANALHSYGDVFLAIVDNIADGDLRTALLPLPEDASQANALRDLARDDPPSAHHLAHALSPRIWIDASHIVSLLPAQYRDVLTPSTNTIVDRLAHPERRDTLRQALDRLASLSPNDTILARFTLNYLGTNHSDADAARFAAEDVACALQRLGDVFLVVVDTIADDDLRRALLPLPDNAALADMLRTIALDDPPTAHRLAHALHSQTWSAVAYALMMAPPHHANTVWQAIDDNLRSAIIAEVGTVPPDASSLFIIAPTVALALAAGESDDNALQDVGHAALKAHATFLRAIWTTLPQETQRFLRTYPLFSDLSITSSVSVPHRNLR